jgi:GR25 family glycosyltransferase involved in LPS biosynthesis
MNAYPFLRTQYERFPAVKGTKIMSNYKSVIDTKWLGRNFSPGEIGIFVSVMEIFRALVSDEHNDYYVILEDDILLLREIRPLDAYVKEAPADWDMIFLGVNKEYCKSNNSTKLYARMMVKCMPGNFAVIVRKRAAQYFLNFAFPLETPIDELYRSQYYNLNMYILNPNPISTDYTNSTTIHNITN